MGEPPLAVREGAWEMGITRAEFLRLLPAAVQNDAAAAEGDAIAGHSHGIAWRITLAERAPRRIAGLSVPVLQVTLRTESSDAAAGERFVRRFLQAFQRAGG